MPFIILSNRFLVYSDIYRRRTFLSLLDVKSNPITFVKSFEPGRIDSGMMNKYIRSVFLFNETVAFTAVKPFYNAISHRDTLLSNNSHGSKLQVATLTNGFFLKRETGPSMKNGPLLIERTITY